VSQHAPNEGAIFLLAYIQVLKIFLKTGFGGFQSPE
jgi:hypothetical protein